MTDFCIHQRIFTDSSETMCEFSDDFCTRDECPYRTSREDYEGNLADIQYEIYRDTSLIF